MRRLLAIIMAAGLVLMPFSGLGAAAKSHSGSKPPIEQPLVREGDFAVVLAKSLNISKSGDEAEAESKLASAGISPKNGWIADYPMTPDILSEVQGATAKAAESGKVEMSKEK